MKTNLANLEEIRARMGSEASTKEAEAMLRILHKHGVEDTDDVPDPQWFDWVADCVQPEVKKYNIVSVFSKRVMARDLSPTEVLLWAQTYNTTDDVDYAATEDGFAILRTGSEPEPCSLGELVAHDYVLEDAELRGTKAK